MTPLPFREVRRRLHAAGFQEVSRKGSHIKFARMGEEGLRTCIVPDHREIAAGTLRSILRQAGISVKEWESL